MSAGRIPGSEPAAALDATRSRLLYDLGCAFAAQVRLDELVGVVLAECREALDAEAASILLHDRERDELYFPYVAEPNATAAARLHDLRFPADHGIAGAVLHSGRSVRIADTASDRRFYSGVDRRTGAVTRNMLCAPLRTHQGTIGVIQVLNRRGDAAFSDEDLAFLDALAGSVAVAIENARLYAQLTEQVVALERAVHEHNELLALRRELDIARDIQQSIVPRTFPDDAGVEIFGDMVPAQEVGGDFYDFFFLDGRRVGIVIGDVSGKGVPAALFMAVTRTLLRSIALAGASPGHCLQRVNELLVPENTAEMFVTVFYGIVDLDTGALEFANAGHNRPWLLRAGGDGERLVEMLPKTGGTVLGVLDDVRFVNGSGKLGRGDAIFLYTDGITEAMDEAGTLFGDERLEACLAGGPDRNPRSLAERVVASVARHCGTAAQSDDITMLALRR